MGKLKKTFTAALGVAATSAVLVMTPGTSSAAVAAFRLSNFQGNVAICVNSAADRACMREYTSNKSKVFDLDYKQLTTWRCSVRVYAAKTDFEINHYYTKPFNRAEFKECLAHGDTIKLKRLDGSEVFAPMEK